MCVRELNSQSVINKMKIGLGFFFVIFLKIENTYGNRIYI